MAPDADALTWRTLAGFLVAAALLAAVATPVALWVGPEQRAVVPHIAVALLAAGTLRRLAAAVRGAAWLDTPSEVARVLDRPPPQAEPDPGFSRLSSELRSLAPLRPGAEPLLWTRLRAIAAARGVAERQVVAPHGRRVSKADLERLIGAIEQAR